MKTIDISCLTDDNYAPYCGIMLTSLFENNKHNLCRVFIIVGQPLAKKHTQRFIKLGKAYDRPIIFINFDESLLKSFPRFRNSLATYYRLFMGDLLPESVNKVLYLDGDIVVNGDLSSLWSTDLSDKAVAVVTDKSRFAENRPKELHYPIEAGYFNAGVLLINLDYWRANEVGKQCISFLENHSEAIKYYDQDVLNAVLWDKKIMLSLTFNYQTDFLMKEVFNNENSLKQKAILEAFHAPIVIHFGGGARKPWSIAYYGKPFQRIWDSYKKISFWSHVPMAYPKRKVVYWLIKRFVLWPLGIYDSASDYILVKNKTDRDSIEELINTNN